MTELNFFVDRTVVIHARRSTVFRYFTDSARFARWWGAGSSIQGVVGGPVLICYPDGSRASGVVREIVPDERIVFTFGYEDPQKPIAPGGSLVTIRLEDAPQGTRLHLRHAVADAATRNLHLQGWRYQLAVFGRVTSDEEHEHAAEMVSRWFGVWNEPDPAARLDLLSRIALPSVTFRDPNGMTDGLEDLAGHIGGALQFMPGVRLEQRGAFRHSHGAGLADFAAVRNDGTVLATGTNVYRFLEGRISEVTGVPSAR